MKDKLLAVISECVAAGWTTGRACSVLEVDRRRVWRRQRRRDGGEGLEDSSPGGNPIHALLGWEVEAISDPEILSAELERARIEYNTVRLHAGIGYVTPADEHQHKGETIRQARQDGLARADQARRAARRTTNRPEPHYAD